MQTTACYWITGLPGAGKTTLARSVYSRLREQGVNVVMLDGDELREVLGGKFGYSRLERQQLAMTYARFCRLLNDQGVSVVIATVSLFHSVHAWNRANLKGYREILLDVPAGLLSQRNQKGLYSAAENGECLNLPGVNQIYEFPVEPHLRLMNDGSQTPDELAIRLTDDFEELGNERSLSAR